MYYKCCVPGCTSSRQDVLLHKFPLCKKRLEKWLESIPDVSLRNRKSELAHLQICHKHFEARFVTPKKRLKITAYPSLFQESEIKSGNPLNSLESGDNEASIEHINGRKLHYDHTYSNTAILESPIALINTDQDVEEESVQEEVAILCDNCQNVIDGFRYKCVTCENYNLCKKCEMMEIHSEHYMLRIPKLLEYKEATDIAQKLKEIFAPDSEEVLLIKEEDPIGDTVGVCTNNEKSQEDNIHLSMQYTNIIQSEACCVLDQCKEKREEPVIICRKRKRKVEIGEVCDEIKSSYVNTKVNAAPEMVFIVSTSGFNTQESSMEMKQEIYDESELASELDVDEGISPYGTENNL